MIGLATWLGLAWLCGLGVRQLGLPPLVGYLGAGFVLQALGAQPGPVLPQLAHAGVLLLLFGVGLKLRLKTLLRPEVWAGALLHMLIFAALLGAALGAGGLPATTAWLLAASLAFSSTVVAAKVLEGKRELRAFHGRVAIGILIVQDLVAVVLLSSLGDHRPSPWALALLGLPLLQPLAGRLLEFSGHDELLVLFGLVLALLLGGGGFEHLGLSAELGALLLGALLAGHGRATELADALWGLKEVLLVGFFLQIGLSGGATLEALGMALLLCLALPVKAALYFVLLPRFRLRARTAFLTALGLSTFSEFGLILAQLGVSQGLLGEAELVTLAMAVAASFAIAAPVNRMAHGLYERLEPFLLRFETATRHPDDEPLQLGHSHMLIMGMGRVGTGAYDFLRGRGIRVAGLDSDPGKVEAHRRAGRRVLYADAEDPGLWHNLDLSGIEAVLLAMPELEANTLAARGLRSRGYTGLIAASSAWADQIPAVREAGADVAYDHYEEAGVGFAEHVWERLYPEVGTSAAPDPS